MIRCSVLLIQQISMLNLSSIFITNPYLLIILCNIYTLLSHIYLAHIMLSYSQKNCEHSQLKFDERDKMLSFCWSAPPTYQCFFLVCLFIVVFVDQPDLHINVFCLFVCCFCWSAPPTYQCFFYICWSMVSPTYQCSIFQGKLTCWALLPAREVLLKQNLLTNCSDNIL